MGSIDDKLISQHNYVRGLNGLAAFTKNGKLTQAARNHAHRMATGLGLSHDGWDTEIRAQGYAGTYIGQNIASGCSQDSCINAWMNSPPHRANILNGHFDAMGVGVEGTWWCVNFGGA